MSKPVQLIVFRLDEQRYALPLSAVERIVRAAEVTPLPRSPELVLGVIDLAGSVFPVLNVRRRFRLTEREISPADHFLIAHAGRRTVVLVVDEADGLVERWPNEILGPTRIAPGLDLRGVARLEDGLVLVYDLEKFLSWEDTRAMDEAMNSEVAHGG